MLHIFIFTFPPKMQHYNQIQELSLVARPAPSLHHLLSCISEYVSVCIELLSFDYTQINLAIQPRSIDISPLYIHQHSTQGCRNSCCNINARHDQKLCGQQPINQANCRGSTERGVGGEVIMIDQDLCCCCSAVSLLSSLCQDFYDMIR